MSRDYSSLERALAQLEKSLEFSRSPLARQDDEIARQFQAAAIQAFQSTCELSHIMLRRYLAAVDPSPGQMAELAFPDLIRAGYGRGLLLRPWRDWAEYRRKRGITSHSYYAETMLAEAFTESDLPYTVDIVDLQTASPVFREAIAPDLTPLLVAGHAAGRREPA